MFRIQSNDPPKSYRSAIIGLLSLSVAALAITVWVMVDFLDEQRIVQQLIRDLPPESQAAAQTLAGELRWQFRLSILVLINLVATGIAVLLLWRAYQTTQYSLRDFKAQAGDILSSMDQAVITTDLNGQITSFNVRAVELLGLQGDMLDKPLAELTDQIDLRAFRRRANQQGDTPSIEDFHLTVFGSQRCLRTYCQPLRDIDNVTIGNVIQLRDVTEQIHVENQMRRMERFMGLGSLAAGLHHEIKNPLAALSLHVQLLEEQLEDPTNRDEIQSMLHVIKTEVSRVGSVLEGFRDFASVGRLHHDAVDLKSLVQQQVALIRPRAEQLGVELKVQYGPGSQTQVVLDRVRIEQVLLNLMINALQAMPSGGTLTIQTQALESSDELRLTVSDTGGGIPESARSHIFDPYFTTKSDGTGMGLALSDKIVRQHGGTLDFETSSSGTTFEITLPRDARSSDNVLAAAQRVASAMDESDSESDQLLTEIHYPDE
ncbi:two-component system sensor histidine kinase NtrB [Roseiconus nitratireducens]|nr:ATP-binding protein [Roseiconus nitratireducens]